MGKRTTCIAQVGSLLAAGALCFATEARAAKVVVGSATGDPGSQVTISVNLQGQGASVAGTQNDITFDADTPVAAKTNGKPDCAVNPNLLQPNGTPTDKTATSFAFRPNGCSPTGTACTSVRALVLSTDNTDPIGDGALYTCKVNIAAGAAGGDHVLVVSGIILSDPSGVKVADATGANGTVAVSGAGPTPTSGPACAAPRPAPAGPNVWIPDQNGPPAPTSISVKLAAGGAQVAGTQNDITFNAGAAIKAKTNGKPDCAVSSTLTKPDGTPTDKTATSFAFRPNGCSPTGTPCTSVRALVLSTDNTDAIGDGNVLYTCNINAPASNVTYAITGVILSDPAGVKVTNGPGQDGMICVGTAGPSATPTNTSGVTPATPTSTPPTVVINTPTATIRLPTATATTTKARPTATAGAAGTPFEDEDGCQIGTAGSGSGAWLLLIPVIGLLVMRRRSR